MASARRRLGLVGATALAVALWGGSATAQTPWTTQSVRLVVPYATGGTTDYVARIVAQKLSASTGMTFYVENRAGGSGTIGTQQVVRSPANGAHFLVNDTAYAMLPSLFGRLSWDHDNDLIPVTTLIQSPVVLVVPSTSRFQTLDELMAYGRAHPGELNFGSGGAGSSAHLQGEMFGKLARMPMQHVPYKGAGEAMLGVVSGQVDLLITAAPTAIPQVQGGKVRALAVSSSARISPLQKTPTFAEAGLPTFDISNWFGLAAPKGTPASVIDSLYLAVGQVLLDPELKQQFASVGIEPGGLPPAQFKQMIREQTAMWTRLATDSGLRPSN